MFNNGTLKQRINFTHRRMKSSIEAFERSATKKTFQKLQKPQQILERAKAAYRNENFVQTVSHMEEYLEYKYLDNQALYICAVSYLHLNQPMEAIQKLQKITNSYPNKDQACLLLAMSYAKVENSQKSLQVINECLQRSPRFEEGYSYRGKLYLKFEQFALAERDFFYSLKLNPQSFINRVGLGDCYYQQQRYELSLKYYDQSLQHIEKKFTSNISDINMKKGVCYFQLQKWSEAIVSFEKLFNKDFGCETYYYLGVSYIKIGRKQQGILNLEYCIKMQQKDSTRLVQKAFKILIQLYLTDFQFYEAINLLKIAESLKNDDSCKHWQNFVEGCMLIIKSYYQDGLNKLKDIYDLIKKKNKPKVLKSKEQNGQFFHQENQFLYLSHKPLKQEQPKQAKKIVYNPRGRKSFSLKHVRKASFNDEPKAKTLFKAIEDKPIVKLISTRNDNTKLRTFFKSTSKKLPLTSVNNNKPHRQVFTQNQIIFIMPILLKFKAYGQFFINNYLRSLDTYQEYESYMKNIFGKETSDLMYNKIICEAFLLGKTELYKEAIQKLDLAVEQYQRHYNSVPVQPLLYKIGTYLKLALPYFFNNQAVSSESGESGYEYLQQVLDTQSIHNESLKNNHLSHYYLSIMYYFCQKYEDAQSELQKTLKIVEECSWKFLYLKGVIEILLENYYDAIKEFTAGLILDQSCDLYLGRSIAFLLEGMDRKRKEDRQKFQARKTMRIKNNSHKINEKQQQDEQKNTQSNSEVFIENSFQDLQKFIELQTDQDKISLWVTKLLFFNQAYDEAGRALQKVQNKCPQLLELQFWLKFYEGEFQECGQIGSLIIDAFQGKLFPQEENQKSLISLNHPQIIETLKFSKINTSYEKWILILHLFKKQKYSLLIKLLQKLIFDADGFEEEIQLKYNLGIAYLMQGQKSKAFSLYENCFNDIDGYDKLKLKINKVVEGKFDEDECIQDLSEELCTNGNHRLSQFLSYRSVQVNDKNIKRIYLKPSIPFPSFPKPKIKLKATKEFFEAQLQMQIVQKRIEAPWIKMNKEKVQFTDEIVDAYTDFLKQTKDLVDQKSVNFRPDNGENE